MNNTPSRAVSVTGQPVRQGFKVDISRGERIGRVSSEWFSRPDDERYLSLSELYSAVRSRANRAITRTVESRTIRVDVAKDWYLTLQGRLRDGIFWMPERPSSRLRQNSWGIRDHHEGQALA